jgi:hypothetical protein
MFIKLPLSVENPGKASFPYFVLYHTSTRPDGPHGTYASHAKRPVPTRVSRTREAEAALTQEEKDIFMAGLPYKEFVEAR